MIFSVWPSVCARDTWPAAPSRDFTSSTIFCTGENARMSYPNRSPLLTDRVAEVEELLALESQDEVGPKK